MTMIEAIALDATHLELQTPLPQVAGQRLLVCIMTASEERAHLLRELESAYQVMSIQERQAEIALAEEGLQGQPDVITEFAGEDEATWWE
jgi:hypothetical protein